MSAGSFYTPPVAAKVTASFTRPADTTSYAQGDLIANSTTAGSVMPLVFEGCSRRRDIGGTVRNARLQFGGGTGLEGVGVFEFELHLFTAPQTFENGDNGVFMAGDSSAWIGSFWVGASRPFTNGYAAQGLWDSELIFDGGEDTSLYGYLSCRKAFTPLSGDTFTVSLWIYRD